MYYLFAYIYNFHIKKNNYLKILCIKNVRKKKENVSKINHFKQLFSNL